ncbi:hypothetical protein COCCADRAFT_10435 [Bipolaris zeicola 26-R-13]|uniref:Uncharacterized protein n=1 Tax=Cochliobolus carbonum (strain 26-R-13) TaxID=930089 RepID=W6XI84_COCC2|nr:uncharacterized protein COCCADRAFT_10435 [Bipolaris zeicola 26-R-13]EUC26782.1 hypothetical protein COCCADRAFT_10435 [Bipolaris zeicola 26-R-13]
MKFSIALLAIFAALGAAGPTFLNLATRDECPNGCGETPCCSIDRCCYPCREGSDADCSPVVTE